MPEQPKTLQQVIRHYSDPETCIQAVAAARWPKGVECPACEGKDTITSRLATSGSARNAVASSALS